MTNLNRVKAGVPTGGEFAPTEHDDIVPALPPFAHRVLTAEERAVRYEQLAASRAGLEWTSAKHVAELMAKSPEPVYEENAATLAAANGTSADAIKNIDQVFNHGLQPLMISEAAQGPLADKLAEGGLTGKLEPYTGTNPDAGEKPLLYTSESGRELIVSDSTTEGFTVMFDDPYDEDTFSVGIDPHNAKPVDCARTVKDALWDMAVTDAVTATSLSSGDFYELREVEIREVNNQPVGELLTSNDDGMYTTISYDFDSGAVTVYRDDVRLEGFAADMELAAVFEGLNSEPANGDFHAHAKTVFTTILTEAVKDPDARHNDSARWAKEAEVKR
jgi:hypothetical protein